MRPTHYGEVSPGLAWAQTVFGKELTMTTFDDGAAVLRAGEEKTVSFSGTFSGNRVTFVHGQPDAAYSVVEWAAAPGAPGTPPHLHRATDEAFYVLEGAFGFRVGERALEAPAGTFVFVPKGLEHAFWNGGTTEARLLSTVSPPGFEGYFEELAEGLAAAGDDEEAARSLREELSEKYDIEVVGPPMRGAN
jgi:mannose-6-phosphate isomerase-like protein (cupin superfamily)